MKSLAMINFNRISPIADFYSKITLLDNKLEILNKNVLYITHECDKILKLLKAADNTKNLQKQVDDYFEDDETSPQTDLEEEQIKHLDD